jgi:uncharacterized membrane protein YfcA
MDWIAEFLPEALSGFDAILLVVVSFFTSFLTASVGIGGGVTLLAVMAQILPAAAIVPVHGIVQLGSNVGRAGLMWRDINKPLLIWFTGGSIIGAVIGGQIVVALPVAVLQLILGLFVLYATWGKMPVSSHKSSKNVGVGGAFSTLLTMFVGATGPFVAAILKPLGLGKLGQVATMSACMVVQHLFKVVVFGVLGFAFAPYLPLIVAMILVGFLGTVAGRRVLEKASERVFKHALNAMLTVLAVRLLWVAAQDLWPL